MKFNADDLKFALSPIINEGENEADRTEELEEEELETAAEEDDDEDDDPKSDGQLLYELLRKRELIDDGDWDNFLTKLKTAWEQAASDLTISEVAEDIRKELSK